MHENASLTLIQAKGWVYWDENELKLEFSTENHLYSGFFLVDESISHIFETWKNFPDTDLSDFQQEKASCQENFFI